MAAEFNVYQVYVGGLFERATLEPVNERQAVTIALGLSNTVGARIGSTCRVFITDGDDHVVWDWRYGAGVVFPAREQI